MTYKYVSFWNQRWTSWSHTRGEQTWHVKCPVTCACFGMGCTRGVTQRGSLLHHHARSSALLYILTLAMNLSLFTLDNLICTSSLPEKCGQVIVLFSIPKSCWNLKLEVSYNCDVGPHLSQAPLKGKLHWHCPKTGYNMTLEVSTLNRQAGWETTSFG